jgi:replicative DNA helicase
VDTFDPVAYLAGKGWHGRATGGHEVVYPCFFDCGEDQSSRKRKLYLNSTTGMYDCKVCGTHGGPYLLAKHFGDILTDNQLHTDQQLAGDPFARRRLLDAATTAAADMLPANPAILDYLTGTTMTPYGLGRGLTPETVVERRLGFAGGKHWSLTAALDLTGVDAATLTSTGLARSDGRDTFSTHITIPYLARGHTEQIRGRNIGATGSKYLSAAGAGVALYNRDSLDDADEVLITEGEFDAMIARQSFAASGDEKLAALAVVALPGTSSWPTDLPGYLTGVRRIWLGLDADEPGRKATAKLADTLGRRARPLALPEMHQDWTDWIARGGATCEQIAGLFAAASGRRVFSMADAGRSWRAQRTLSGGLKTGYTGLDSTILPGLLPGQVAVLYSKTGTGKQNDVDEVVPTPTGWRRFGDLQPGDQVFGQNGSPTTVTGVWPQIDRRAWRVTFSDRTSLVAGPDHLWQVSYRGGRRREWIPCVMSTTEILAAGLHYRREYRWIIPMPGPVQFPKQQLLIAPYTFGALLANGYLTGTGAVLTTPDPHVVARCRSEHILHKHKTPDGACRRYGVLGVLPDLRRLGLTVGSYDKFIPEMYLTASVEQRIALLQGLMDGDGSTRGAGRASVRYHTMSRRLAADVQRLVWSLGGTAMDNWMDRGPKGVEGMLSIMMPSEIEPFYTPRKVRGCPPKYSEPRRAIVSIEPVEDRDMQCISVDAPDALYQIGAAHIVTHNTILLCNMSYNMRRHNILFISLEMTREEIYERLRRIYLFWNPNATDAEVDAGLEHIYICDENRLDENAWADVLEEYQTETGTTPDLVMVDYLGYYARGHAGANRYEQVSNAIMSLKAAAKGNGNPDSRFALITPSQVNRGARAGAPVELDDARDSGGVEETADFVLSLYRPEDALTASDPTAGRTGGRPAPPVAAVATGALRLGVLKSRHGGVGREFGLQMDLLTLAIVEMNTAAAHRAADHNNLHRRGHDWNYLRMTETQPRQLRIVT